MPLKFLIIQTAFVGDVVLATSLAENLHAACPDADIDFLVRKGNETLLHGHPFIRKVLVWDKKKKENLHLVKMLFSIRKENYDKVINVQRFASTGLLTAFSGAKETIGFDKNPFHLFFSTSVKHVFGDAQHVIHEIERNHVLIRDIVKDEVMRPKLYPSAQDELFIEQFLSEKFLTISPASVWFTKQFPVQKWATFIKKLPHDYRILMLGGKDDSQLAEDIIRMTDSKQLINLCGKLSFLQSAALMKRASMNYVNDSAPMHFASAMNAPITVVYCSTIPAFGYGPLSDTRFIIERPGSLYCRPCGLHGHRACPEGHFKCALEIEEEQLLKTLVYKE